MFLGRQQLQGWKRSWDHWQHHMLWLEIWVPILWSGNETPFLWYAANVSLVMQWSCTTRHHAAPPIYTSLSLHYTLFEFLCRVWFCLMISSWPTLIICSWTLPKVMAVVPMTEQIPVVGTKSCGRVWWCYISCCFLCCACEYLWTAWLLSQRVQPKLMSCSWRQCCLCVLCRFKFRKECVVIHWSGDNPCSLAGPFFDLHFLPSSTLFDSLCLVHKSPLTTTYLFPSSTAPPHQFMSCAHAEPFACHHSHSIEIF